MATNKDRHALISRFEKLCKENKFSHPPINRYAEQWASDSLIESYGLDEAYKIMAYYFSITQAPRWQAFARNAGNLRDAILMREEEAEAREFRIRKMRELMNES